MAKRFGIALTIFGLLIACPVLAVDLPCEAATGSGQTAASVANRGVAVPSGSETGILMQRLEGEAHASSWLQSWSSDSVGTDRSLGFSLRTPSTSSVAPGEQPTQPSNFGQLWEGERPPFRPTVSIKNPHLTQVNPTVEGISPLVVMSKFTNLDFDARTKITVGPLLKRRPEAEQQSDPLVAIAEVEKMPGELTLSPRELRRIANSSICRSAFKSLVTTFESTKNDLNFWDEPGRSVADFIPWYYQASRENREKASRIVNAQENYEKACLEYAVPDEIGPLLIKASVGILMFGDKVFCTALRTSTNEILTAKHCFLNSDLVQPSEDVMAVLAGTGQMWFAYEAEPSNRFGVCPSSLPQNTGTRISPDIDNIKIRIRETTSPAVPIKWAAPPIKSGTSLYLRGYFPFVESTTTTELGRLRSTAVGGCFAHSGAGQCFFHTCQTTPIMSGAPVFIRPEQGATWAHLEVAGIHLGAARMADPQGLNGSVCTGIDGTKVPSSNFAFQPH